VQGELVLFDLHFSADVVLINGEGTLHHNFPVVNYLLHFAYSATRRLGKPIQIINHLVYPEVAR